MQFDLTPAQLTLQAKARELAQGPFAKRAAEIDRSEQYPWDNVALLKDAGFMGMTIPVAYGGQGASCLDAVLVIEEVAKCCGATGRIVVEGNMGALGAVMKYGTDSQKRLAAQFVLSGDKPAICITEPDAGSAASEMITRAERRGNTFVINGKKHWITGGGVSRFHLIFARVFDDRGHEEESVVSSLSATKHQGLESACESRQWASAAFLRPSSFSRIWWLARMRLSARHAGSAKDLPI